MLLEQIEQYHSSISGNRAEYLEKFLSIGFPARKDEE